MWRGDYVKPTDVRPAFAVVVEVVAAAPRGGGGTLAAKPFGAAGAGKSADTHHQNNSHHCPWGVYPAFNTENKRTTQAQKITTNRPKTNSSTETMPRKSEHSKNAKTNGNTNN